MSKESNTRAAAVELAKILRHVFRARLPDGFGGDITLLELCGIGATILVAGKIFLSADRQTLRVDPTLLAIPYYAGSDLEGLADCIEIYMSKDDGIDADKLLRSLQEMQTDLGARKQLRDIILKLNDEVAPPGKPGRPTKITRNDWSKFLEKSASLLPLCRALLSIQRIAPHWTTEENLRHLTPDYPEQVAYLSLFPLRLSESGGLEFAAKLAKTSKTQEQRLCDIWAGFEFGLSNNTALEVGKQARASLHR